MLTYHYTLKQIVSTENRDRSNLFMNYDYTVAHGGVDLSAYQDVHTGEISADSPVAACERLYIIYNIDRPLDYTGRSMSMSDIVMLEDDRTQSLWYCDYFGFRFITCVYKKP